MRKSSDIPITDEYTIEDYDAYEEDDYEGFIEVDNCDVDNTIYDLNNDETCNHTDFNKLTPINETTEFSNVQNIKQCCPYHGYIFPDSCKVWQYF